VPTTRRKFTVILEPEEDGGYSVHCPALPGCVSQGGDRHSALENINEAIALVLETLDRPNLLAPFVLESIHEGKDVPPRETLDLVADEIREVLRARQEDGLPLTIETVQVEVPSPVSA
jgi:predicted RNase H-like HicB family nuclease